MLKQWCSSTSCNGIWELYDARSSNARFFFWSVIMTFVVLMCIVFTYRAVKTYVDTPTISSIKARYGSGYMQIPEVMVCYTGGLNVTAMLAENIAENALKSFQMALRFENRPAWNLTDKGEIEKYMMNNNLNVVELVEKFSYLCEDMVTHSKRPGMHSVIGRCENVSSLCTSDGKCHVFYNNKAQLFPGQWGGMKIGLKIPGNGFVDNYPELALAGDFNHAFSLSFDRSLRNQNSKRSVLIPLNVRAEIVLHAEHTVRLNTGTCSESSLDYTSNSCPFQCWGNETLRALNCVPIDVYEESMKGVFNACLPFDIIPNPNVNLANIVECNKRCLAKCDEWLYHTSVTYSTYDQILKHGNQSVVSFGYNKLQYLEVEEIEAYSLDTAVANVGGHSGLWLGASMVSVAHAAYYLALAVNEKFRKLYNSKTFYIRERF